MQHVPTSNENQRLRRQRLAYVSGPVDAVAMYHDYRADTHRHNFGTSYLKQLFALSDQHGFDLLVITTLADVAYDTTIDQVTLVNIPIPTSQRGLAFHRAMLAWTQHAIARIRAWDADAALLTAGQNYFFAFERLHRAGVMLLISLHCVLLPKFGRAPRSWRALQWLNAHTVFRHAVAIIGVSRDVIDQVENLSPATVGHTAVFRPTYSDGAFAEIHPPAWSAERTFRLLFVGRVEANKGVFDLVSAMRRVAERLPARVHVDVCGGGSAMGTLREEVAGTGLGDCITLHGECAADRIREFYGASHAVIVPTTSDFEEGYNKVCAEAVLAGRPVITSAVCPALRDISPAAIEVPPDDVAAYADAVIALATDADLYGRLVAATRPLQSQFYQSANSYGAVVESQLRSAGVITDGAV